MAAETILILPPGMAPAPARPLLQTPYGTTLGLEQDGLTVLVREEGGDARAWIYAAKEMGARRLLAAEQAAAISPLLEPGDIVIPADVIDQTRLRPFTFFEGKGYGFIKLNPPFCPDLMAAALSAARQRSARSFKGAVYVGTDGPREATNAELRMFRHWGADLLGHGLLPEAYLARELEMHYVAVAVVGEGDLYPLLREVAAVPCGQLPCTCAETMRFMKEQGVVSEDWHTWL